jgi:hypothetical protein
MFLFARILPLFSGLAVLVNAYANPLACSGVCGNSHDPAVIRRDSDGKYFRFSTGNRISVATASSLSGPWVAKGSAISGGSKINKKGKDDLWVRLCFSLLLMFYGEMWRGGEWDWDVGLRLIVLLDVGTRCLQNRRYLLPPLLRLVLWLPG